MKTKTLVATVTALAGACEQMTEPTRLTCLHVVAHAVAADIPGQPAQVSRRSLCPACLALFQIALDALELDPPLHWDAPLGAERAA